MKNAIRSAWILFLSLAAFPLTAQAQLSGPGFGPAVPIPIADIVFVLDRSGSVLSVYDDMIDGVAASIGTSIPTTGNYRVAVVVFNQEADLAVPFTPANHPMLPALINAIKINYPSEGNTSVSNGMQLGSDTFSADPSTAFMNQLVLITDAAENSAAAIADEIRAVHQARVSVAWLADPTYTCDQLQLVFDLADYESLVDGVVRTQVEIANAMINPPFVGTLNNPILPGVLDCLPLVDAAAEYATFLDDALCPIKNSASPDPDNNLVPNVCEIFDCDNDGIPDPQEEDCDGDGLPDDCELDCNGDGIPDDCSLNDCDNDGIPDECEPDCDGDGIPDDCENDCDNDGIPDDCEIDCDNDGIPDDCEEFDCDNDGIPDECEPDCDGDGIPDDCDDDLDGDGILDTMDSIIGPCSAGGEPGGGGVIPG